jgi:hypothetical protein
MASSLVEACVVDTKTIGWKTVEEAEAGVRSELPSGWAYRLFFGWDSQLFGGVGVVKLVCFIKPGSGASDVKESVQRMVKSGDVLVWAPATGGESVEFLVQELGILEGMADQSGFASVGNLTTSVVEGHYRCPRIVLKRSCVATRRGRREWKLL